MDSMSSAILLSRGGTWNPRLQDPPYLLPSNNGLSVWPTPATVECTFTDSTGVVIATVDGKVESSQITFNGDASTMDEIPAGTNYTIVLSQNDGSTYPIRYGQVIRKEPFYTNTSPAAASPIQVSDSFQRTALGSKWIVVSGSLQMVDNSSSSLPDGVAASSTTGGAAMRYWQEFTSDTVEVGVTLLNMTPSTSASTGIIFGGDINFQVGTCVKFETGSSSSRKVHIGTLSDPLTVIDQVAPVSNTVANLDYYLIKYVESTKTCSVYAGTALDTPLISWTDSTGYLPRGAGYRHVGANFVRANTSTKGIQVTSLTARDSA